MLAAPVLLVSSENAATGFNANVGTVDFSWRPIEQRGEISVAAGQFGFNRQSLYQGLLLPTTLAGRTLAVDAEWARSESDGSLPFGDHNFQRVGGRIQLRGASSQTDAFAGYQHKFFGWRISTPRSGRRKPRISRHPFSR